MTLSREQKNEIYRALEGATYGKHKTLRPRTRDDYREYVEYLKDRKKKYYPKGWTQIEDKLFYSYELWHRKTDGLVKIEWDPTQTTRKVRKKSRLRRNVLLKEKGKNRNE